MQRITENINSNNSQPLLPFRAGGRGGAAPPPIAIRPHVSNTSKTEQPSYQQTKRSTPNNLTERQPMLKIFTVYDSKAEAYLQPFYALATGAAIRMFETAASDPEHKFNQHAADFTLFELGQFDEQTGKIEILSAHLNLGNALSLQTRLLEPEHSEPKRTLSEMRTQSELPTNITQEKSS